ncbi:hypothetical protein F2P56_033261 [Juglans regia]|uniref:Saccharopine dehydrogenase NADP binding domain-containing protein n=1 Tax=Juglans regia TaxID=51240 RepID=A0A833U7J9_JUGRE|nr:hypothetical protein F2P56_033261 [Juglans regia]
MAVSASMHLVKSRTPLACAKEESEYRVRHPENSSPNARVLVLGGTGRVGGSTAIALSNLRPDLRIIVAGRNREKGASMVTTLGGNSQFAEVDIENVKSLEAALKVMAAELVRASRSESNGEPERLRFYYYTAGTGGAGPTILATSFLLLGEEVAAYNKGEMIKLKPYSGMLNIDFGKGIGKRDVYLLNLPEVRSVHEVLGIPTVSARFGTAPFYWNWGMAAMTSLLPAEFLRDRSKVQELVQLFDPLVRAVDRIAGERVSMRVDLECSDGRNAVGIFSHRRLSVSVGNATAAFALAVLEGSTQPGVWFPEEPEGIAIEAREVLLKRAAQGTINFVMNRPPWMVESDPKELGLGIYV